MRSLSLWLVPVLAASLVGCSSTRSLKVFTVPVAAQTDPVPSGDDAADDPAIWVNRVEPEKSLIIGTDKKGGLVVYDLDGRTVDSLPGGRPNNVDLRERFPFAEGVGVLVATEYRADNTMGLLRLDPETGSLSHLPGERRSLGFAVYGSALYHSKRSGDFYWFVGEDDRGTVRQYRLEPGPDGQVGATLVRTLPLRTQCEGMVADDESGWYYVSEEDRGIWRFPAEPDGGTQGELIFSLEADAETVASERAGMRFVPDMEGLTIYRKGRGGYLVASAQGVNGYLLLERQVPNRLVGFFRTSATAAGDETSETDGLDVTAEPLGARYPKGIMVVQDGETEGQNQNFKILSWADVEAGLRE